MKATIRGWQVTVASTSAEVWQHLEELDEDPSIGQLSKHPLFDHVRRYTFRIERLPITKVVTVAYEVVHEGDKRIVKIADFVERDPQ